MPLQTPRLATCNLHCIAGWPPVSGPGAVRLAFLVRPGQSVFAGTDCIHVAPFVASKDCFQVSIVGSKELHKGVSHKT